MSIATAKLSYLRIAPRKVRLVADLIRGKRVDEAQAILTFIVKKATNPLLKLLKQAVVNTKNKFQTDHSNLYISELIVNEGPKLKRWRPRARGRACEIQKKTSHIVLTLDALTEKKLKKTTIIPKAEKIEKIIKKNKSKLKIKKEVLKPNVEKRVKRIFQRKSF